MRDASDEYEELRVIDGVHDPIITDADSIVVAPGELRASDWSRISSQAVDGGSDTVSHRTL